ncbi:MAG: MGDG synthase family glycosyltransferase [Terrimicrobiaceae bacterium]|jgi:processive 1,2-diacylglycerol beta-glucosyltransferase
MGKRVLILSASVGSGHVKAADALARVIRSRPDVDEVLSDDSLDHTNVLHKQFYSTLYKKLSALLPEFLGWWYETSDDPWVADKSRLALDLPQALPLMNLVKEFKPDIILCTHFMPAGVISWLISNGKLDARLGIVITDFHFHAFWITRAFNWYFVAQEEDKIHMEALGLPADRIEVTGIPVEPEFSLPVDTDAVLERHGLQPGRPTLLVAGGALGLSPSTAVVRQLLQLDRDFQAIIVCGKNEEMQAEIVALVRNRPNDFRVLGFTKEMSQFMAAASILLSKPGGMTTAEALARGLPMMILDPIGGQEERNADVLLEAGAAVKCTEVTLVAHKLRRLLDDPERLRRMSDNARRLGRPNAANTIADIVLDGPERRPVIISKLREKALRKRIAEAG